jgi:tetratricopeptide (TPR) repeat protein
MEDLKKKKIVEQLNEAALQCKRNRKYTTSKIILERAMAMNPSAGILWNNLGAVLWNLNKFPEAEEAFIKAQNYGYVNETLWNNYGLLLSSMGEFDRAEEAFDKAYNCKPEDFMSKWENSLTLLDRGEWIEGFKEYDIRRQVKKKEMKPLPYPLWDGEADLNGKILYLQSEQGFGDRILFSRYIHWLKNKYPDVKIKFLCDPKLHNLFWRLKEELDYELVPDRVPWPKADYAQYLLNLPQFHGTTPDNVYPDPGLIAKRARETPCNLPQPELKGTLKVGICWTGNPEMDQNIQRSIPLELILQLAENPDVLLYSFQVGDGEHDLDRLQAGSLVVDLSPELKKEGFVGTAAALCQMDLVITCCTSIAHLSGSLGVPTWVALCYAPYWVWLRGRDDSPWYPSVKLYRQQEPGEWTGVITKIKEDLAVLTSERKNA